MDSLEEQIEDLAYNEDIPGLDKLYKEILASKKSEARETMANGYLSLIGQCHCDYMCGKFNNPKEIKELLPLVERVKDLTPSFMEEHFYRGNIYEMLSACTEDREKKKAYLKLSLDNFREQRRITPKDQSTLTNLAQNLFEQCKLAENFSAQSIEEIKEILLETVHLERLPENQKAYYAFKGTAIGEYLEQTYEFLELSPPLLEYFEDFQASFKKVVNEYRDDPKVFFFWADSLFRIMDHNQFDEDSPLASHLDDIWQELEMITRDITNLDSQDGDFLTALGHLFSKMGDKDENLDDYHTSLSYYLKAYDLDNKTWTTPQYATDILKKVALIHLKRGEKEKARKIYLRGFSLLEESQKEFNDFQLSLRHGDYLYDYGKIFEDLAQRETLLKALEQYEDSRKLAKDFYTQPFYGLAKTHLALGDRESCLESLAHCGKVFSNEYHTHDFREIFEDKKFPSIHKDLNKLMATIASQIKEE